MEYLSSHITVTTLTDRLPRPLPLADGFPPAAYSIEFGQDRAFRHLLTTYSHFMQPYLAKNKPNFNSGLGSSVRFGFCNQALFLDGNVDVLAALIEHGVTIDKPGKVRVAERLIIRMFGLCVGCMAHPPHVVLMNYYGGAVVPATCTHMAAFMGNMPALQLLLKHAPNLEARGCVTGMTALHTAAISGHVHVARALVDAGASLNARDAKGRTPAQLAARRGHLELSQLLGGYGGGRGANRKYRVAPEPAPRESAAIIKY